MSLPSSEIDNQTLISMTGVAWTAEKIQKSTLIEKRRWLTRDETLPAFAIGAGVGALRMAGASAASLHDIYVGTAHGAVPSLASLVHGAIGAPEECGAVDLNAACAGGVVSLRHGITAMQYEGEGSGSVLVLGAELGSQHVNPTDRSTVVLFGDAAAGAVLEWRHDAVKPTSARVSVPDSAAVYKGGDLGRLVMDGMRVTQYARYIMPEAARRTAQAAGIADPRDPNAVIDWNQVDYFVPHQANGRLIEAVGASLDCPEHKMLTQSLRVHGNTSAASIYLALCEAQRLGIVGAGNKRVLFTAIGAGLVGAGVYMTMQLPEDN